VKSTLYPVRLSRIVLALLVLTVPARMGWAQEAALQGLALSTGSLVPAFDPRVTDYTITALGSLFPIEVTALADPKLHLTINRHDAAAGAPFSLTLRPREDVVVSVESSAGEKRAYTVHYLPPTLPSYTVAKLNQALMGGENIFLTPWPDTDNGWLLVVNRDGDPLYYSWTGYPAGSWSSRSTPSRATRAWAGSIQPLRTSAWIARPNRVVCRRAASGSPRR